MAADQKTGPPSIGDGSMTLRNMQPGPPHRGFRLAVALAFFFLCAPPSPLWAEVSRESKPRVALAPVIDLAPKPTSRWLPSAIQGGITYTFQKLSSIKLVDQKSTEKALKDLNIKPGQQLDDKKARAFGQSAKADLVVATAFELKDDETVSLRVRLIEPKSDEVNKPLVVEAPIDRLLRSFATIAARTASTMKYPLSGDERLSLKNLPTFSFRSFFDYKRALAAYNPVAGEGNLSEAMVLLTNAIRRDPRFVKARFQAGLLAARQGQADQAARHFERLVHDRPSFPNAQYNLGLAKMNQGEYSAARTELLKAHQNHPIRVDILNDLALAAYYLKDYDAARGYLATASELAPTSSVTWNNVGIVASAQGAFADSQKAFAKAIQHNPKSVSAQYNLGLAYLNLGELDKAKEAFEKTLELNPRHAKTYYSLALMAEGDGTGKAEAYWKKYLELAVSDPAEQPFVAVAQQERGTQPSSKPAQKP